MNCAAVCAKRAGSMSPDCVGVDARIAACRSMKYWDGVAGAVSVWMCTVGYADMSHETSRSEKKIGSAEHVGGATVAIGIAAGGATGVAVGACGVVDCMRAACQLRY